MSTDADRVTALRKSRTLSVPAGAELTSVGFAIVKIFDSWQVQASIVTTDPGPDGYKAIQIRLASQQGEDPLAVIERALEEVKAATRQ